MPIPRRDILKLYKDCMVYINGLKYSDKGFLKDKVRQEFRQVADEDYIEYYYEKGKAFLERRRFI
jgi:hypothetical protein